MVSETTKMKFSILCVFELVKRQIILVVWSESFWNCLYCVSLFFVSSFILFCEFMFFCLSSLVLLQWCVSISYLLFRDHGLFNLIPGCFVSTCCWYFVFVPFPANDIVTHLPGVLLSLCDGSIESMQWFYWIYAMILLVLVSICHDCIDYMHWFYWLIIRSDSIDYMQWF